MALMQRSGCSLALIASTAENDTDAAALEAHLERLGRLTDLCRQEQLPFTLAMNFGNPGETRATVEHKLTFLRQAAPAFVTLRVATRVLPHTPLAKRAVAEGLIQGEDDLLKPTFYLAAAVGDWLVAHLRAAAATQPRWHLM
jgi:hypothetical protein